MGLLGRANIPWVNNDCKNAFMISNLNIETGHFEVSDVRYADFFCLIYFVLKKWQLDEISKENNKRCSEQSLGKIKPLDGQSQNLEITISVTAKDLQSKRNLERQTRNPNRCRMCFQ